MPYQGDRVKKEREALDLIIKMKKGGKDEGSHTGELIFFVIIPLGMALIVMQYKPILEYAAHNKDISAAIKMVYPDWQSAEDAAKLPINAEQAVPADGQAVPGDGANPQTVTQPAPKASPDTPTSSDGFAPQTGNSPPAGAGSQTSPGNEGAPGGRRGSLLH